MNIESQLEHLQNDLEKLSDLVKELDADMDDFNSRLTELEIDVRKGNQ